MHRLRVQIASGPSSTGQHESGRQQHAPTGPFNSHDPESGTATASPNNLEHPSKTPSVLSVLEDQAQSTFDETSRKSNLKSIRTQLGHSHHGVDSQTKAEPESEASTKPHWSEWKFTPRSQINIVFFSSWIKMITIPFIPAGFAVKYTHQSPVTVFAINFVAIFPLTLMLSEAADDLMIRVGDNLGAVINSTFSNAVQFITAVVLLRNNQIAVLQTTLIGVVLSSMHLMLGLAFIAGGHNRIEQAYNMTVGKVSANLLLLAMVAIILPTMGFQLAKISPDRIVKLSRGIAFILVFVYAFFLFFQLKSHRYMYGAPSKKNGKRKFAKPRLNMVKAVLPHSRKQAQMADAAEKQDEEEVEDEMSIELHTFTLVVVLVGCTTILGFNTDFATNNLDGLMAQSGLSTTFVGIVLLPLLSNDFTVIKPAVKDKMDLCVALTVGKCLQTILLVAPFTILVGWAMHKEMTLNFDPFETTALFASVIYISSIIQNGRSTYLDGVLLCSVFLIICLTSYWV